jgi:ketosteroid isomerase-like protein
MFMAACLFCAHLSAQTKPAAAQKLLAMEERWNTAFEKGDEKTLDSLLAEDFVSTLEDGAMVDKAAYIALSKDHTFHYEASVYKDMKARLFGDTAIVTGLHYEKGSVHDKPFEQTGHFTDTWKKISGRWQCIASHYSIPVKE